MSKKLSSDAVTEYMWDKHGRPQGSTREKYGAYPKSMATRGLTSVLFTSFVIGAPVEST